MQHMDTLLLLQIKTELLPLSELVHSYEYLKKFVPILEYKQIL